MIQNRLVTLIGDQMRYAWSTIGDLTESSCCGQTADNRKSQNDDDSGKVASNT